MEKKAHTHTNSYSALMPQFYVNLEFVCVSKIPSQFGTLSVMRHINWNNIVISFGVRVFFLFCLSSIARSFGRLILELQWLAALRQNAQRRRKWDAATHEFRIKGKRPTGRMKLWRKKSEYVWPMCMSWNVWYVRVDSQLKICIYIYMWMYINRTVSRASWKRLLRFSIQWAPSWKVNFTKQYRSHIHHPVDMHAQRESET